MRWQCSAFSVAWDIEFTDEFNQWWAILTRPEQEAVRSKLNRLCFYGPALSGPHSKRVDIRDGLEMRELRVQTPELPPLRAFYVFDPRPAVIVLLGGDKTGDNGFYDRNIPRAYNLYDEHVARLLREEII